MARTQSTLQPSSAQSASIKTPSAEILHRGLFLVRYHPFATTVLSRRSARVTGLHLVPSLDSEAAPDTRSRLKAFWKRAINPLFVL